MTSDTDKHERIDPPGALHADVIGWCERMLRSARKSEPPDVVEGFERLLELARGER